uniref:BPTI/Kunitz inhibitor domain-containing protein n=1 Tax=Caenorhabditis japonica TaxID=281687 RepID=A0A8R1HQK3_CAEJA
MLVLLSLFLSLINSIETGKEHIDGACHDPLYFGATNCDKQWEIRYHMDVPTETCLAFNFTGCDPNWNNFKTAQACYEECLPLDHQICPVASKIYKTTTGEDVCREDRDCGLGKYCNLGNGYGQCCDEQIRDKVDSDYSPKCSSRQSVVQYTLNGVTAKLIGKKCSHNFCPHGATCVDGHFFAACCQ